MTTGKRKKTYSHGVSKQDKAAIRSFAALPKPQLTGEPVMLAIACPCSFRPYPHLLRGEDKRRHDSGKES